MVYNRFPSKNRHRLWLNVCIRTDSEDNQGMLIHWGESNKRGESKRHVSYNEVVVSLGIKIVTIAFHRTTIKISFQAKTWNAREIEMLTIKIEKTSAYFIYIFVITLSYLSPTMSSWLIKAMYPEWNSMLHLPNLLRVTLVQRSLLLDVLASNYG